MRYAILVVIGLVLAGAVAMLLRGPSENQLDPVKEGEKVLIAKVDLQPGTFIVAATMLDFVDMDPKLIKPEYIQKKNANLAELEGAVVRSLIKAGEPILKEKVVTPKEGGFLSAVLYPGERAISVGVDVVSANAGFIFPGDKVDLLLTHQITAPDGTKRVATETFVENIRVLAIDQQVNNPDNKALVPKTVTLEVTPKQAEEVLVAVELGKISLILRSSGNAIGAPGDKNTFTRDSDVSKVLKDYAQPADLGVNVSITRGKTTTDTKVNPSPSVSRTPDAGGNNLTNPGVIK